MGISTFKGGVHPYDGKDLAKDQPIRRIKPKEILVYPLSQHIGAPASPIVAVGDTVLRGQKIAEAGGFVSAPVFASVSGTVKAIEPRHVATGDLDSYEGNCFLGIDAGSTTTKAALVGEDG